MERDHYPSFVVSDIYSYQLMPEIVDRQIEIDVIPSDVDLSKAGASSLSIVTSSQTYFDFFQLLEVRTQQTHHFKD